MPSSLFYPQDLLTGLSKTMDPVHSIIHDGQHYTADHYVSVGTGTAVTVLITPPAAGSGRYIHFIAGVTANNTGVFTFSENPNASGGTTLVSANNYRDMAIDKPDPVVLAHTVTYTSSGTVLETILSTGVSTNQSTVGGSATQRNEWLLKGGATYLMRFVADNAATRVNFKLTYYYREV